MATIQVETVVTITVERGTRDVLRSCLRSEAYQLDGRTTIRASATKSLWPLTYSSDGCEGTAAIWRKAWTTKSCSCVVYGRAMKRTTWAAARSRR